MFNPGTPLQDCFSMWKNSGFTTIFFVTLFLTNEEIGSAVSYLFIGKFFDNSSNFFWLINTVQIAETIILGYIGYLRMKELEINETKR